MIASLKVLVVLHLLAMQVIDLEPLPLAIDRGFVPPGSLPPSYLDGRGEVSVADIVDAYEGIRHRSFGFARGGDLILVGASYGALPHEEVGRDRMALWLEYPSTDDQSGFYVEMRKDGDTWTVHSSQRQQDGVITCGNIGPAQFRKIMSLVAKNGDSPTTTRIVRVSDPRSAPESCGAYRPPLDGYEFVVETWTPPRTWTALLLRSDRFGLSIVMASDVPAAELRKQLVQSGGQ